MALQHLQMFLLRQMDSATQIEAALVDRHFIESLEIAKIESEEFSDPGGFMTAYKKTIQEMRGLLPPSVTNP